MQRALAVAVGANIGPVTLYCAPDTAHPRFEQLATRHGVTLTAQTGADLGERMHAALTAGLKIRPASLVIGTDCPFLDAPYLTEAASVLCEQAAPVVIGPAVDGGYVLFGATRLDPSLFHAVPWGGAEVLAETRRRLRALCWDWRELTPLNDIDRPEDLALLEHPEYPGF